MLISLSAKNKTGFVDGSITKPITAGSTLRAWERCNSMMISWMLGVLDQNIARSVLYFKTVREIWLNLEERYGTASGTMLFSLQQSLFEIRQGSENISGYYTKMKMLWHQLDSLDPLPICGCTNCTCEINKKLVKSQEDRRLVEFLMKLNEGFEIIRGNILLMSPLPSISQAYRLLLQEESHKRLYQNVNISQANSEDTMAFGSRRNFEDRFKSQNTQNRHNFGDTRRTNSFFCDHCKMTGHTMQRCYKLHGYPPNGRNDKRQAAVVQISDEEPHKDPLDNVSFTAA
ncbi:uncharacterized protein LOC141666334 [Apium graveolens]|uniref:uncharacterized protein LOC141666334 n=1 Tax=Apium graveolens TaxID=4045 RepID=UPI003D795483